MGSLTSTPRQLPQAVYPNCRLSVIHAVRKRRLHYVYLSSGYQSDVSVPVQPKSPGPCPAALPRSALRLRPCWWIGAKLGPHDIRAKHCRTVRTCGTSFMLLTGSQEDGSTYQGRPRHSSQADDRPWTDKWLELGRKLPLPLPVPSVRMRALGIAFGGGGPKPNQSPASRPFSAPPEC